jgi:hypothetical protein
VTVREAEWSADDVALLIASRRAANVKRGPHGIPLVDAMNPALDWDVPDIPKRDYALAALLRKQEAYEKKYPSAKGDRTLVWSAKPLSPE